MAKKYKKSELISHSNAVTTVRDIASSFSVSLRSPVMISVSVLNSLIWVGIC